MRAIRCTWDVLGLNPDFCDVQKDNIILQQSVLVKSSRSRFVQMKLVIQEKIDVGN